MDAISSNLYQTRSAASATTDTAGGVAKKPPSPEELAEVAKGGGPHAADATRTLILKYYERVSEGHHGKMLAALLGDIPVSTLRKATEQINERNKDIPGAPTFHIRNEGTPNEPRYVLKVTKGAEEPPEELPIGHPPLPPPPPTPASTMFAARPERTFK